MSKIICNMVSGEVVTISGDEAEAIRSWFRGNGESGWRAAVNLVWIVSGNRAINLTNVESIKFEGE
ncbi:hypothetical protein MOD72_11995 [Bacillus haynesii]|uniref:hypothetical protein n=1 Tax=Bacillus haynesii TaxID=1925021 RepID=UPI00227E6742|nr:hypothetical protein [Bacillus haynesii]MCY8609898.1 hypothetical protein [Bacillus haynesii]MEC0752130.1 hypothetical protein [Bacillus haynesii]